MIRISKLQIANKELKYKLLLKTLTTCRLMIPTSELQTAKNIIKYKVKL